MPINSQWFAFNAAVLNGAPEYAGVYALAQGQEIIYYGRALGGFTTIKSRLNDHLAGREGRCTQQATQYAFEVTQNGEAREKELLEEYRALAGRLPRCNERVG
jgi:hypothetical protein